MAESSLLTAPVRRGGVFRILTQLHDAFDTSTGHDHDGTNSKSIVASVTYGVVGDMAAAGTGTANTVGTGNSARVDHIHALGAHDHSDATKGDAIVLAAMGANIFSADANGRGKFAAGLFNVATFQSVVAAAILSADATGRAFMATGYFNAAHVLTAFASNCIDATNAEAMFVDSSIPSDKVNWTFGTPGSITPDDSASAGTAGGPARSDHQHGITCAAPSAGLAAADAEGAATTFARSNHVHKATVTDDVDFSFGASDDAGLRWSTGDASNHAFVMFLGASLALHICELADVATDWNVGADTHPTLYVHSATTPITDFVKLSHDATTATLQVVGGTLDITAVGGITINESSADVDVRMEGNGIQYAFYLDAGLDALVLGSNTNTASVDQLITVSRAARTATATVNYYDLAIQPAGAVTIPAGATSVVASLMLAEPNITLTGTVTDAATLYISGEPTEGGTGNYGAMVVGSIGLIADAKDLVIGAGRDFGLRWSTADADNHAAVLWLGASNTVLHICAAGDVASDWNVAAVTNPSVFIHSGTNPITEYMKLFVASDYATIDTASANWHAWHIAGTSEMSLSTLALNIQGNSLQGANAANGDLTLVATSSATVTTAYIVASNMVDGSTDGLATKVVAGAIGDGNFTATAVNGVIGIDSTNGRIYYRYGAAWHYSSQDAGFSFPAYERQCPICGLDIMVGDAVTGVINEIQTDGARHGVYVHAGCTAGRTDGIKLPNIGLHQAPEAAKTTFPNAQERIEMGVVKEGSELVPVEAP